MLEEELYKHNILKKSKANLTRSLIAIALIVLTAIVFSISRQYFGLEVIHGRIIPVLYLVNLVSVVLAIITLKDSITQLKSTKKIHNYIAAIISIVILIGFIKFLYDRFI